MARVLVVMSRDLRDASTLLGAELRRTKTPLIVFSVPGTAVSLANPADLGLPEAARNDATAIAKLCRSAEACCVALRPEWENEMSTRLVVVVKSVHGSAKGANYEIMQWLQSAAVVVPPAPVAPAAGLAHSYHRQAMDALAAEPRVRVGRDALKRASKIAAPIDDCLAFVDFMTQAMQSLCAVARGDAATIGLDALFARYPAVEFASSGQESVEYTDSQTGTKKRSAFHLKARGEPRGMHHQSKKPRIFFDIPGAVDQVGVYVLYVGPHTAAGTVKTVLL